MDILWKSWNAREVATATDAGANRSTQWTDRIIAIIIKIIAYRKRFYGAIGNGPSVIFLCSTAAIERKRRQTGRRTDAAVVYLRLKTSCARYFLFFFPASNYIEVVFLIDLSTSSNMGIGSLLYLMISYSLWLYFMQISAYY